MSGLIRKLGKCYNYALYMIYRFRINLELIATLTTQLFQYIVIHVIIFCRNVEKSFTVYFRF